MATFLELVKRLRKAGAKQGATLFAALAVPLAARERSLGILLVTAPHAAPLRRRDRITLERLSASLALALDAAPPPLAARKPKDVSVHGDPRLDDYFWLRDKTDPAVLAHLRAENAYTEAVMAPLQPQRAQLYAEMVGRLQETDTNPPAMDSYWYKIFEHILFKIS